MNRQELLALAIKDVEAGWSWGLLHHNVTVPVLAFFLGWALGKLGVF